MSTATPTTAVTGGRVVGNELRVNASGAINGYSTIVAGTIVKDNPGFGPGALNALTGSSPLSRTCGAAPEQHSIVGGTVTGVTINGTAVGAVTSVILQPGDVLAVTYTSAPTSWKYRTL